jgi:hypothetical protein
MNDAIEIDDSGDKNSDVSENAGRHNPQKVLAQLRLSIEGGAEEKWRFNKNDFNLQYFCFPPSRLGRPTLPDVPAPTAELYWGTSAQIGGMSHWLSCFDHFCLAIAV